MSILPDQDRKLGVMYSVILPVHNEERCLPEVLKRTDEVLTGMGQDYEIICVDDGSTDFSWEIIRGWGEKNPRVKGVKFLRNFGQQLAIHAGLKECSGAYVAVMDADGQDPPEVLPELFGKCAQGYDVVYAVRQNRKEGLFKRAAYKWFYLCYKKLVSFEVPLDSGDFSVFTRPVCNFLQGLPERTPFIRGLRSWYGGRQVAFSYDRQRRLAGRSNYTLRKLLILAVSASVSFSKIPLRMMSALGVIVSTLSFCAGIAIVVLKLTAGIPVLGWTSTSVLIIFFGGLNLFVLGIIGEYIGSIFDEVKGRPGYLIEQKAGFRE